METLMSSLIIIVGILQILLFFKLWGMTDNMKQVRDLLKKADSRVVLSNNNNLPGWAKDVTEDEKVEAIDMVLKCHPKCVIVKCYSSNTLSHWKRENWESATRGTKKLIYSYPD